MSKEPAVIIGAIAAIIVAILQQAIGTGLVTSSGAIDLLNVVISVVPVVAAVIIRQFVTPAPSA